MSGNGDTSQTSPTPDTGTGVPARARPVSRWVVAAPSITLVLGLLLGGSLTWVATRTTGPEADEDRDEPSNSTPSPGTAVVVPDACLEAAASVRQAIDLIRAGVDDIRAFRAQEILDLLNELEDLDRQASAQAETCSEVQVTDAPLSSPTP